MDHQYPRLKRVFNFYNNLPHVVNDYFLIACQHIMEPQVAMFESLIAFGFDPAKIIFLGKIYSTNFDTLRELQEKGITAIQPEFFGISFDQAHRNNCEAIAKEIREGARCVVLDDGGELIKAMARHQRNILFGVEQTSSGFRNLEKESLPFPVLNVARSVTKLTQEAPLVARHLNERILLYFEQKKIVNPVILIVGLGPIGESILEDLKQNNMNVEGFDIKYGHTDLVAKIQHIKPDVIIGATGTSILTEDELRIIDLSRRVFLISASSSDREFPVVNFRSGEGVHDDVVYKNITFVNNGFPFSFMGNRYEMTPTEIEKTMCLLGGAIMHGVTRGIVGNGLREVPTELEELINE